MNDTIKEVVDHASVGIVNSAAVGFTFADVESFLRIIAIVLAITYSSVKLYLALRNKKAKRKDE